MSKEKWEKGLPKQGESLWQPPVKGVDNLEVDIALLCFDLNFETESCYVS